MGGAVRAGFKPAPAFPAAFDKYQKGEKQCSMT
jgi:hypothetical protein